MPGAGTFASQYITREGERQTRPNAERMLLQPIQTLVEAQRLNSDHLGYSSQWVIVAVERLERVPAFQIG